MDTRTPQFGHGNARIEALHAIQDDRPFRMPRINRKFIIARPAPGSGRALVYAEVRTRALFQFSQSPDVLAGPFGL